MAQWSDLPLEIQDHILSLVCESIILEYWEMTDNVDYEDSDVLYFARHYAYPAPLQQLLDLLLTCKRFWQAVTSIKVHEGHVIPTLQLIQHQRIKEAVQSMGSFALNRIHHSFVALLQAGLGPFWKNPLALEDKELFFDLYLKLSQRAQPMFVCMLSDFIQRHATEPTQPARSLVEVEVDDDSCDRWILSKGSLALQSAKVEICSVTDAIAIPKPKEQEQDWRDLRDREYGIDRYGGLESDDSDNESYNSYDSYEDRGCPKERKVEYWNADGRAPRIWSNKPGSWWLIRNLIRKEEWHLVSYDAKAIWEGPGGYRGMFHQRCRV